MTDLEKAIAFFTELGLEPIVERNEAWTIETHRRERPALDAIQFGGFDTDAPKVHGYPGFYCVFEFDTDGAFYGLGIFE